ncbi:hypothetical protein [Bacillus massilinigeriensis]|uniref:hypothetical protein n=1 Tax=Bacillus massilionigeriensis TaxID=1805475 RepID=UPI0009FFC127|nr:hypothetical protein [Bacillus massilionigeriensis]
MSMDDHRKKVIVNEILYWKESRLLPEHYCDYLLTLYTEGNRPIELDKKAPNQRIRILSLLFILLIPLAVFFIYFTELSFIWQIALEAFLIFLGLITTFYFSKKGLLAQVPLVVSALILLLTTVEMITRIFPNQPEMLYMVLFLNCLLWLFTGKLLKLIYFFISGILGIIVLIISIFI